MNLDDLLESAASTHLEPPKPASSSTTVPSEIKPWLASSANVPKEYRDRWTQLVKLDHQAVVISKLQPSHSYRSLDTQPINTTKILNDLVRKSASVCGFDESKTVKLLSTFHPVTETDYSKQLQAAYNRQLLNDLREAIVNDPNFDESKYPNLAAALAK
jgi:hypothetical protein